MVSVYGGRPICRQDDCFQNKCGVLCELLTSPPSQPCPFYKTVAEAEIGRAEAHRHLVEIGRQDLIEQYEHNKDRRRQW